MSSVKTLEEAKATPGVLYMRMPVTQFGTVSVPLEGVPRFMEIHVLTFLQLASHHFQMEFKRFTEILEVGGEHAVKQLDEWAGEGKLPTGTEGEISSQKIQKRGQSIRRNSI